MPAGRPSSLKDAARSAAREARARLLREALVASKGAVTQASRALGLSKRHTVRLVREHGLNDFARALRSEPSAQ